MHLRALALLTLAVTSASPLRAAYISELLLGGPMPDAVEITASPVSPASVELAIVDAGPGRAGDVLALLELELDAPVTLFTAADWPAELWTSHAPLPPRRLTLAPNALAPLAPAAAADNDTAPAASRTLILLAPGSGLAAGRANLFHDATQRDRFDSATILDLLTLAPGAAPVGYDHELAADPATGWAISRPRSPHGQAPQDKLLVGPADETGRLLGLPHAYHLTPGWQNETYIPEPGVAALIAVALIGILPRRPTRAPPPLRSTRPAGA